MTPATRKFACYDGQYCLLTTVDFLGNKAELGTCTARPGRTVHWMPKTGDGTPVQPVINGGTVSFARDESKIGQQFAQDFKAQFCADEADFNAAVAKAVADGAARAAEFRSIKAGSWGALEAFADRHRINRERVYEVAHFAGLVDMDA